MDRSGLREWARSISHWYAIALKAAALEATAPSTPEPALDVERLARVFFRTTFLGTMFMPEARRLAEEIVREYAAPQDSDAD